MNCRICGSPTPGTLLPGANGAMERTSDAARDLSNAPRGGTTCSIAKAKIITALKRFPAGSRPQVSKRACGRHRHAQ